MNESALFALATYYLLHFNLREPKDGSVGGRRDFTLYKTKNQRVRFCVCRVACQLFVISLHTYFTHVSRPVMTGHLGTIGRRNYFRTDHDALW